MTDTSGAVSADQRRAHVEGLLARYPDLEPGELAATKRWFKREASALDIGLLASNDSIAGPYRRFRADHLDSFGWRDIALIAAVSALLIGGVVAATVLV